MVMCGVTNTKFEFDGRVFQFELACKDGKKMEISLSHPEAEKLYNALKDMEISLYVYKTGGVVDDY